MTMQRVTSSLEEVARASGVSKSTVSRILGNRQTGGFSATAATRRRVLEAAERLNYRPNPMIGSIRAKQTNLIALLGLRDFGTAVRSPAEVAVKTLMERLYEHGLNLCTNIMNPKESAFAPPRWRVDGAVVVDCSNPQELEELEASGLPYVTLNGSAGPNGSSVTVDDDAGMRDAIHHLIALGHRRIAFAMPDGATWDVWHESLARRHRAYLRTLHEMGLEPVPGHDRSDHSPTDFVRAAVHQHGATAVVAYHLLLAVKLLRAASMLDLRVPHKLSLVCFNDLAPSADLIPALTAMSLPSEEMGARVAELLLERIGTEPAPPRHVVLPERLVIRESTAPPPLS